MPIVEDGPKSPAPDNGQGKSFAKQLGLSTWPLVAVEIENQVGAAGIAAVAVFTVAPDPGCGPEAAQAGLLVWASTPEMVQRLAEALEPLLPDGSPLRTEHSKVIIRPQ